MAEVQWSMQHRRKDRSTLLPSKTGGIPLDIVQRAWLAKHKWPRYNGPCKIQTQKTNRRGSHPRHEEPPVDIVQCAWLANTNNRGTMVHATQTRRQIDAATPPSRLSSSSVPRCRIICPPRRDRLCVCPSSSVFVVPACH